MKITGSPVVAIDDDTAAAVANCQITDEKGHDSMLLDNDPYTTTITPEPLWTGHDDMTLPVDELDTILDPSLLADEPSVILSNDMEELDDFLLDAVDWL